MGEYKNLSLRLSKEQLKRMIQKLTEQHWFVFWGFDRGKMVLNVYNAAANNQLVFVRRRDKMELTYARIMDDSVLDQLNHLIGFAAGTNGQAHLSKSVQYKEVDYYLLELHDYMQQGNTEKIKETKAILAALSSDAS